MQVVSATVERPGQVQEAVRRVTTVCTQNLGQLLAFPWPVPEAPWLQESLVSALLYCLDPEYLPKAHVFEKCFYAHSGTAETLRHYRNVEVGSRLGE